MWELLTVENLIALLALAGLEIALGIDNLLFISILAEKLPEAKRAMVRKVGLLLALGGRLGLLAAIGWIVSLKESWFALFGWQFTGKNMILLGGGLFLIYKAATEIYEKVEAAQGEEGPDVGSRFSSVAAVLAQVVAMDAIFSLDSVLTAVGMVESIAVMATAIVLAMVVMILAANHVGGWIERHPSLKVLALSFLLLIGFVLVGEGCGAHIDKAYIYAAMGFAILVEVFNILTRSRRGAAGGKDRGAGA